MIAHPTRHVLRPVVLALLALLLAGSAVLLSARPAAAHDSLISSDPANGTTVEVLPAALTLSFSAALLSDEGSTVVQVTDAAGTELSSGSPETNQNVVTQPLDGTATGNITVLWRVVSSDGHPVSGELSFTVAGPATAEPTPTVTASASASVVPSEEASPSETPLVTTTVEDDAASPLPWIIGAVIVLLVLAAVITLLAARARQGKDAAATRSAGRDDSSER